MEQVRLCVVVLFYLLQSSWGETCPKPEHCTCNGILIRCVGMEAAGTLRDVIDGLVSDYPSAEELILEDTQIATLNAGVFKQLSNLKKLSFINAAFSGSGISALAFEGLAQLTDLTIKENTNRPPIIFPTEVFAPLTRLRRLDLSRNGLLGYTVAENILRGLGSLETLDLSFNSFGSLSGNQLSGLTSLKKLSLGSSEILAVTLTTFSGLSQLETLDLSGNPNAAMSDSALTPLSSLKSINLRSNKIKEFSSKFLDPVKKNLETLDLSKNEFEAFKDNVFASLGSLKVLNVSAMIKPVHRIGPNAFAGLKDLVMLDLRWNQMSHVKPEPFKAVSKAEIKLDDNAYFCNCEVASMYRWMMNAKPNVDVVCMMPIRLRGKSLRTLDLVSDIRCKTPKLIAEEKVRADIGQSVTFECGMVDYHDSPEVIYRVLSGSPLPSNRTSIRVVNTTSTRGEFTLKYVFTVADVRNADSGQVECYGEGDFGSYKTTIDIFYGQVGLPIWVIIVIIVCVVVVFAVIIIAVVLHRKKKKSEKYSSVPRGNFVA